eukprot:TRINITY_DN72257_c0_g1_i1.p1 TRINITY_DN72257_c0_g1~~TRINITY_DN72257_c0_g1_i1.p1  ORF type:complete len:402 (+),score=74.39 TRINITY_DN72257_c0_g1_i1:76-1206(+)
MDTFWTDKYDLKKCIGEGQAGTVYRAVDVAGNASKGRKSQEVVIKMHKDADEGKFAKEVELLERVSGHPNVGALLTSHSVAKGIVMPFYGELDLYGYVWQCDGLSELQATRITRDLLAALDHVHACGVIHRDVKPENIVLAEDGRAVLLDFDIACDSSDATAVALAGGTPGYIAPEVLEGNACTFLSDVFSVGCVVYFMFARVHPFLKKIGATLDDVLDNNFDCKIRFGRRFRNVSRDCLEFIVMTAMRNPRHRLSGLRASKHPWLAEKEAAECLEQEPACLNTASLKIASPNDDCDFSMLFDKTHSLPSSRRSDSKLSAGSRASRAKAVGRQVLGKLSRAMGRMRGKTSTVSPLGMKYEEAADIEDPMTGVLVRD